MRWRLTLIGFALCAALAPLPEGAVERAYSSGLYPLIEHALASFSNLVPVALFDVLIVSVVVGWISLSVRDLRGDGASGWLRALARIAARTVVWSAALYLLFLVAWGFNYRRAPLESRIEFEPRRVTADGARSLGFDAASRLNALYDAAHREAWPPGSAIDPALAAQFARVARDIRSAPVVVGRPKTTWLDWYLRRAAVDGMTDPFFLETLVVDGLLPFERPLIVAHEWSHLAGFADEGEANFLGWLTCVRGSPGHQYSGWLFLYQEIMITASRRDRADLAARLGPGPASDLRAVADRVARTASPRLAAASWRAYDAYLRANRVESGAASYTEVVRLVLGARFGVDWTLTISAN